MSYTISDIIRYLNFDSISENIEIDIAYADNQPSLIILSEFKDEDLIFKYSPPLRDKYPGVYTTKIVSNIVEEILEDVAKEYYEQTSLIHAIELGEEKFKNKRE